jgi:uncharacterized damage-inducible protein DinB
MGSAVELLSRQMDQAFEMVRERLDGLTEEEFFWEPAPGCWTLRWMPDGKWSYDYAWPEPDPGPFTTIAWRVNHIATCKVMYHEHAFGAQELTWPELEIPRSVPEAVAMLDEGQGLLVKDLGSLEDEDLQAPRLTNWGEEWPTWRILWTMVQHDLWHGGEIGALRDLHRVSQLGDRKN